ncbi:hypothetical protein FO488_10775 [Geobacter sp. FeAm09]|uniref:dockerin type I repeat-containing protein n=1 Tax=Geobacter sp. FeAm09 TaxID=2597769 RepID=UPI0011EE3D96|nr:dockerin type I repeat-containing protein [Geobacter sp. FeAm09]QEM68605.1 hypothetical protein FO488_10775 [Geobacter sp. FeAm09]
MRKISFSVCAAALLAVTFLSGGLRPAGAATTLGNLATDYDCYVVSGTQANSNQGGTAYADTTFYPKGGMMISAARDDTVLGTYYSTRTMDTVFSFNTGQDSTNGSNGLTNGINVVSAFDTKYGAGNWAITSVSISLSTNYAAAGVQPNNPDFNTIAAGYFSLNVLGGNPDITTLTWNKLQTLLGTTAVSSAGTFYWPATQDLLNTYVTYQLNVTTDLVNAIKSGKVTFLGLAADSGVGYLFNTNTKGTPPYLVITADAITPAAGPVLSLSTLADKAVTNNPTLNVTGTVTDSGGIQSLTINGASVTVNPDGSFSQAVALVVGDNTITTIATDFAGLQATDIRTITLDQTAPNLTITLPSDNSVTNAASVEITGSVDDAHAVVTASVNGGQTTNAHMVGTSFDVTVSLAPGTNTVTITATDQANNKTTAKRTVIADTAAPSLAVTAPPQDLSTTQASYTICGTVTNAITTPAITIVADGRAYAPTLGDDGGFCQPVTLSANKVNAVVVTATDQGGNTATVQRNIVTYPKGDINGDGKVDISDALKALRVAVDLDTVTPALLLSADVAPLVNGVPAPDGIIDVSDALVILKKVVGTLNW